jgi:hypothetical protein
MKATERHELPAREPHHHSEQKTGTTPDLLGDGSWRKALSSLDSPRCLAGGPSTLWMLCVWRSILGPVGSASHLLQEETSLCLKTTRRTLSG